MKDFFHHLFAPHQTNNHRAKLLHSQVILPLIGVLFLASMLLPFLKQTFPGVLGSSIDISTQQMVAYTNEKRSEKGLNSLIINNQLSQAAKEKANDMFANNYWAHNSPTGTTPWVFIKGSGYSYVYAGENLARGFTTSQEVVDAWMKSPTHKENMLSGNYQDVGFAVVSGRLNGEETVLVVEMFGGKNVPSSIAKNGIEVSPTGATNQEVSPASLTAVLSKSIIDTTSTTRKISIAVLVLFIFTFTIDMIIIERKKIVRVVGHNIDHIFFLTFLIVFILLISKGVIG